MNRFNMAFPNSVAEASELLSRTDDAQVIAGGTALGVVIKEGIYQPRVLINIRPLEDELRFIHEEDDNIRIGALSTLHDIEADDAIDAYCPVIAECLSEIAGVRVRNSATIGGHLAHADVHLDLPPVLAGLDATVVASDGSTERDIPLSEFLRGYYETDLRAHELITEIRIPKPERDVEGIYLKHRYFSEVDWPCVGVAAFVFSQNGAIETVRVLFNSVSHQPVLEIEGIDEVFEGTLTDDDIERIVDLATQQVTPTSDLRGSAAYKERMAGVFARRALTRLAEAS